MGFENENDISTQPKVDKNSVPTSSADISDDINEKRRSKIRTALDGNIWVILPDDTTTANDPSTDFVEMGRMMTEAWKGVDAYGKKEFDEMAAEGRDIYRVAMKEYNQKITAARKSMKTIPDAV